MGKAVEPRRVWKPVSGPADELAVMRERLGQLGARAELAGEGTTWRLHVEDWDGVPEGLRPALEKEWLAAFRGALAVALGLREPRDEADITIEEGGEGPGIRVAIDARVRVHTSVMVSNGPGMPVSEGGNGGEAARLLAQACESPLLREALAHLGTGGASWASMQNALDCVEVLRQREGITGGPSKASVEAVTRAANSFAQSGLEGRKASVKSDKGQGPPPRLGREEAFETVRHAVRHVGHELGRRASQRP